MKSLLCILTVLSFSLITFSPAFSQSGEHPTGGQQEEHPTEQHGEHPTEEHGEHPTEQAEHPTRGEKSVTIESVADFLEGYVERESTDGWMEVRDEEKDKTLQLALDKIHRERLTLTEEGTYFVCADFTNPEGKTYDIDFWVKKTPEGLEVTDTMAHKEAGEPRYQWMEKDGTWTRKPVSEGK